MVKFVDVTNIARWVQREGVENIVTGMAGYLEEDYKRWEHFQKAPRFGFHSPFGVMELMPTANTEEFAFKYVSGYPANPLRGYQTVTAFGMLADVDTGYPTFQSEMTLLTALRTAAVSAMVAKHLARPDSKKMAMIGAGSQSEFQALAFRGMLGIEDISIYDVDPKSLEKFKRNLEPLGFHITIAQTTEEAVEGADIITTCTADQAQNHVLQLEHVKPGVHLNAVGGDCEGKTELDERILDKAKVFVEYPEQTRIEGEIQQKPEDFPVVEFWKVLAGKETGRDSVEQITLFDDVGFAINDYSALRYLRDSVAGTDLEVDIELFAEPDDPKDLFSMVANVPAVF